MSGRARRTPLRGIGEHPLAGHLARPRPRPKRQRGRSRIAPSARPSRVLRRGWRAGDPAPPSIPLENRAPAECAGSEFAVLRSSEMPEHRNIMVAGAREHRPNLWPTSCVSNDDAREAVERRNGPNCSWDTDPLASEMQAAELRQWDHTDASLAVRKWRVLRSQPPISTPQVESCSTCQRA